MRQLVVEQEPHQNSHVSMRLYEVDRWSLQPEPPSWSLNLRLRQASLLLRKEKTSEAHPALLDCRAAEMHDHLRCLDWRATTDDLIRISTLGKDTEIPLEFTLVQSSCVVSDGSISLERLPWSLRPYTPEGRVSVSLEQRPLRTLAFGHFGINQERFIPNPFEKSEPETVEQRELAPTPKSIS